MVFLILLKRRLVPPASDILGTETDLDVLPLTNR